MGGVQLAAPVTGNFLRVAFAGLPAIDLFQQLISSSRASARLSGVFPGLTVPESWEMYQDMQESMGMSCGPTTEAPAQSASAETMWELS